MMRKLASISAVADWRLTVSLAEISITRLLGVYTPYAPYQTLDPGKADRTMVWKHEELHCQLQRNLKVAQNYRQAQPSRSFSELPSTKKLLKSRFEQLEFNFEWEVNFSDHQTILKQFFSIYADLAIGSLTRFV